MMLYYSWYHYWAHPDCWQRMSGCFGGGDWHELNDQSYSKMIQCLALK